MAWPIKSNNLIGAYSALARACATCNTVPQSGGKLLSPSPLAPAASTPMPQVAMNPALMQMLMMWFVMLLNMFMSGQSGIGAASGQATGSGISLTQGGQPQGGQSGSSGAGATPAQPGGVSPVAGTDGQSNPFVPVNPGASNLANWIAPDGRLMKDHPDLNLTIRDIARVNAEHSLVGINGETDPRAPKLAGLLNRVPTITGTYSVFDWNWQTGTRGGLTSRQEAPVTMVDFQTQPGEVISVPPSGYQIDEQGHQARVVYADEDSIAINYTGRGDVVDGYTIHVEGIQPRADLKPGQAVSAHEALGQANSSETKVAVRDKGSFMDPRSAKDWWS